MSEEELTKLPKGELAARCWAATVNEEFASESAAEAWTNVAELLALLEDDGAALTAVRLYIRLKKHREHVVECQTGSCEHEFDAMVRRGVVSLSKSRRLRERSA